MAPTRSWIDRDRLARLAAQTTWTGRRGQPGSAGAQDAERPGTPGRFDPELAEPAAPGPAPRVEPSPIAAVEPARTVPTEAGRAPPPADELDPASAPHRATELDPVPRLTRAPRPMRPDAGPRGAAPEVPPVDRQRLEELLGWATRATGLPSGAVLTSAGEVILRRGRGELEPEVARALFECVRTLTEGTEEPSSGHFAAQLGGRFVVATWHDDPRRTWFLVLVGELPPAADVLLDLSLALQDAAGE